MTTFNGNTVTLAGKKLQVGDTAPDFSLTDTDLSKKNFGRFCWSEKSD